VISIITTACSRSQPGQFSGVLTHQRAVIFGAAGEDREPASARM
jgi:hypothetical protein